MIYTKFKEIKITDTRYDNGCLSFTASFDGDAHTYSIQVPESWQKPEFRGTLMELFNTLVCIYAMGYRVIAEKVDCDFTISSVARDFLYRIQYPFFSALSNSSGHFLMAPPCLGDIDLNVYSDPPFSNPLKAPYKTAKHAQGFSGGKESMLCHAMLSDIREKIHPLYVLNKADRNRPAYPMVDNLEFVVENNYPWQRVFDIVGYDHWYPSISLIRLFYTAIHGVMNGCYYIINGNEFNRTEYTKTASGVYHFGTNFGQSNYALGAVQHYLYYSGLAHHVYSPVQNMSELLEEILLFRYYPTHAKLQTSCFNETIKENGESFPCGSCPKCLRLSALVTAIQNVHDRVGLDEKVGEQFKLSIPAVLKFGSTNSAVEEIAVKDLLDGKWNTKEIQQALSLREDLLHPFDNIPKHVLDYIKKLHNDLFG